jgi:hypothetical protein
MEHDWMVERQLRERSRRLWLHGTSRELSRSDPDGLREDGQDGAKPRAATEIVQAHVLLDELGVARSAPDSDAEYTVANRIQVLADRHRLRP